MSDIFLSYSRKDIELAKKLARALEGAGLSVWWDRRLLGGQQFSNEIERRIEECRKVVVMWSANAANSRWVRDEAAAAADQEKLVPIQIDQAGMPLGFRQYHTIDFSDWDGDPDRGPITDLVGQLRASPAPGRPVTRSVAPADPILAVLPFDNLSADEEMRYFSDGISDEILVRLMHGSEIKLLGRASSFQFREERKANAARELDCTHLLDGSVRRSGNKVRTTVHLLEIGSEQAIWSGRFDDDMEDILDTQDRIAKSIAEALNAEFELARRPAIEPEVYDRFLKAKVDVWRPESLAGSLAELEKITAKSPGFADAWAHLAMWSSYFALLVPPGEAPRYRDLARRAIAACEKLQHEGGEALLAQYRLLPPFGAFVEAIPVVARLEAAGANAPAAQSILSLHYSNVGNVDGAEHHARLAYDLDPDDLLAQSMRVLVLYYTGQLDEATDAMKDQLSLHPENHHIATSLVSCAVLNGDWETVEQVLNPDRIAEFPLYEYEMIMALALAMRPGHEDSRQSAVEGLVEEAISLGSIDLVSLVWIAKVGDADAAYDLLEKVRVGMPKDPIRPMGPGLYGPLTLFVEGFREVREDPRFPRLAARLGLAQYWVEKEEWPDCTERLDSLYDFTQSCREAAQTEDVDVYQP